MICFNVAATRLSTFIVGEEDSAAVSLAVSQYRYDREAEKGIQKRG